MCLHDILTIYLYGGSYLVNLWNIGATIALIHDTSDILLQAAKIFSETKRENLTGAIFVLQMAIWFYTRIIIFPWVIYKSVTQANLDLGNQMIVPYFAFGLSCLVFMHAYWFHIFVKILLTSVLAGEELKDVYENDL